MATGGARQPEGSAHVAARAGEGQDQERIGRHPPVGADHPAEDLPHGPVTPDCDEARHLLGEGGAGEPGGVAGSVGDDHVVLGPLRPAAARARLRPPRRRPRGPARRGVTLSGTRPSVWAVEIRLCVRPSPSLTSSRGRPRVDMSDRSD